jgi:uncharacterized protein YbjT (DUF2867 family)
MDDTILITGSTGGVGMEVIRSLQRSDASIVAAVRPGKIEHARTLFGDLEVDHIREFDFTDPTIWECALEEVTRVFLLRPPQLSNVRRDMRPFLSYLKGVRDPRGDLQIRQLVFLSVQGAERNRMIPHHKIEMALADLGLPYTHLRPSFFMQNLTTTHLPEIRDEDRIFVPAGNGRTNFIDVRDIGDAAAKVLTETGHVDRAYTLTGPRDYTYGEVAEILSEVLGRRIEYQDASPLSFLRYHGRQGKKLGFRLVMLALYSVAKYGRAAAGSTGDLEVLIGNPGRDLVRFVEDHEKLFSSEG